MKKRRLLSAFLAASLLCTMAPPATVLAAEMEESIANRATPDEDMGISGGKIGEDYIYENGVVTILKSTPLTFYGNGVNQAVKGKIVVSSNVNADITIQSLSLYSPEGAAIEVEDNATAKVKYSTAVTV